VLSIPSWAGGVDFERNNQTALMNYQKNQTAFTLIELLVVIAIIAILAAILFPVFAQAREKARQISCVSNEKQLGLAFQQYVQDNDETFPRARGYESPGDYPYNTSGWAGEIWPYVKSKGAFACPDDTGGTAPSRSAVRISYAMNDSLMGDQNANTSGAGLPVLTAPSLTVLLCEVDGSWSDPSDPVNELTSPGATCDTYFWAGRPGPGQSTVQYATGPIPGQTLHTLTTGRHAGGSNWLAADGHVKFLNGSRISGGKDAANNDASQPQTPMGAVCTRNANCAAGTGSMNNGGGPNSATLTFSKY